MENQWMNCGEIKESDPELTFLFCLMTLLIF